MDDVKDFQKYWREICPYLERMLRARGVRLQEVDDVLQETALRFIGRWDALDTSYSLASLARAIALNYLIDQARTEHSVPVEEIPDAAAPYDLEDHALARLRLGSVGRALSDLQSNDQAAILAELDPDRPPINTSATKMARSRARKRLSVALDRIGGAFGAVQIGWRRTCLWWQQLGNTCAQAGLPAFAAAAGVTAVAVLSASGALAGVEARSFATLWSGISTDKGDTSIPDRTTVSGPPGLLGSRRPEVSDRSSRESTVAAEGPVHARTGEGKGYQYAGVCVGEDGEYASVWVTYSDGTQDGDDDVPGAECSGDGKKKKKKKDRDGDPSDDATAKPRRVERRAKAEYVAPSIAYEVNGQGAYFCLSGDTSVGCKYLATHPEESFLTLKIVDSSGMPVPARVSQSGTDTTHKVCGKTADPIPIVGGIDVFVRLLPFDPACAGIATSGTIRAIFSNLR